MLKQPWLDGDIENLKTWYAEGVPVAEIARRLKRADRPSSVSNKAGELKLKWGVKPEVASQVVKQGFTVDGPAPSPNRPIEELLSEQAKIFLQKAAKDRHKKNIRIHLDEPGPFAILFMGDPHVDDDGCDLLKLQYDLNAVKTGQHVYGATVGDLTNNWVGTLGRLFSKQHTTDDEAFTMLRWLVSSIPWLFLILGNHDKWGPMAQAACDDAKVKAVSHGGTFLIYSAGSDRGLKIDARHSHLGNSQYNASHGQIKRSYRGSDAHVIIGGHIHTSAYTLLKNGVTGCINHCLRLSAYKRYDDYAEANHFDDDALSPSVLLVCDPEGSDEGFVSVFHDIEQGLLMLSALRARFEQMMA